jgi:hypothetical protein
VSARVLELHGVDPVAMPAQGEALASEEVPGLDCGVGGAACEYIRVECETHDAGGVAVEHANALARAPIPARSLESMLQVMNLAASNWSARTVRVWPWRHRTSAPDLRFQTWCRV